MSGKKGQKMIMFLFQGVYLALRPPKTKTR